MTLNLCVGGSNSFAVATSTQKFGVMAIQVLVLGKKKVEITDGMIKSVLRLHRKSAEIR